MAKKKLVEVTMTGSKRMDKVLKKMPTKLANKLIRKAAKVAVAQYVLPEAQARVPYDTGELSEALKVRVAKQLTKKEHEFLSILKPGRTIPRQRIGAALTTGPDKFGGQQGDQFYGHFHEFGWDDKPEGDPFMRPALYGNAGKIKRAFSRALNEFVRETRGWVAKALG